MSKNRHHTNININRFIRFPKGLSSGFSAGFSLVEVLVSSAVAAMSISFFLYFQGQNFTSADQSKNYLRAVGVMENLYQDIVEASEGTFSIGSFFTYYDRGGNPYSGNNNNYSLDNHFYEVKITVRPYALLTSFQEVFVEITWLEEVKPVYTDKEIVGYTSVPKKITFHVLK